MSSFEDLILSADNIDIGFHMMKKYCSASSLQPPVPEVAKDLYNRLTLTEYYKGRTVSTIVAACVFAACREQTLVEFVPVCYELGAPINFALQALWVVEQCALGIQSYSQYPSVKYVSSAWEETTTYSMVSKAGVGEPKKILLFWSGQSAYTLMGNYNSTNPWLFDIHHRRSLSLQKAVIRMPSSQYLGVKFNLSKKMQSVKEVAAKEVAAKEVAVKEVAAKEVAAKQVAIKPEVAGTLATATNSPKEVDSPIADSKSTTAKVAPKAKKAYTGGKSYDQKRQSPEEPDFARMFSGIGAGSLSKATKVGPEPKEAYTGEKSYNQKHQSIDEPDFAKMFSGIGAGSLSKATKVGPEPKEAYTGEKSYNQKHQSIDEPDFAKMFSGIGAGSMCTATKVGPEPQEAYIGEKSDFQKHQSTEEAKYAQAIKGISCGEECEWTMIHSTEAAEKNQAWVEITGNDTMTEKNEGMGLVASMKKLLK